MKFCNQCGTKNTGNAKFCQECGNPLQSPVAAPAATPPPSPAMNYGDNSATSPLLNLRQCIAPARSRLKELRQTIPPASSDAVAPLMGRLQTIPPEDTNARIELIEALGRTRDPVVLRALLLVAGAGSKHVRRAVAVALSGINHTLSAYILLPMLEDPSSRVRNSAIQALIYINQPHCAEVIVSACLGNKELKRIAFDTVQRLRPIQRDSFVDRISQVNPAGAKTASDLIREFRAVAGSLPSANRSDAEVRQNEQRPFSNDAVKSSFSDPRSLERSANVDSTSQRASVERDYSPEVSTGSSLEGIRQSASVGDSRGRVPAASEMDAPGPLRADSAATAAPRARDRMPAPESGFSGSQPAPVKVNAEDFVKQGMDLSSMDDLTLNRLMSDLVPENEGVRSSDSLADFRFFESVSTNLNDSRAGWQSPENSVFDYNPNDEERFSDTQTFSTQNTNSSEFSIPQMSNRGFGSGATAPVPSSGSSAGWSTQPASSSAIQASAMRAANAFAGDPSRSGSHLFNPPQSFPPSSTGPGWPSGPQAQLGPQPNFSPQAFPGPQAYPGMPQPFFPGYGPQHFPQMHAAMPPMAYLGPPFQSPQFGSGVMNPAQDLMTKSSVEIATMSQPQVTTQSSGGSAQNTPESVAPLSEDVLINGGTMLEIPTLPQAGKIVATTDSQSATPVEIVVNSTIRIDDSDKALKKAQNERNLERLRQARDHAFRALLDVPETISGVAPRLISKKITSLLTTPAGDHAQIKLQLAALGKTGSPHALETLASFCQKPAKEIRISCAEALGMIRHQGSVVQLLKFLGDKSGTVIETALKSMISLQDKAVYPVILAAGLVNSSLKTIVAGSIETLGEEYKPAWEQQLLACLKLDDPDLVAFSVQLLVKLTGVTHVDLFMTFAASTEPVIRAAAIEALVKTGAKKVIGTINEAMIDDDPIVRTQAAIAVGTLYSPRSVELLGKMLQDSNLTVRRSAAQSAAKIDESDLGDSIVAALGTETDHLVIEYLLEGLNKNGGKNAYSLLVQFVEGSDTELREIALKALRKLKLQESAPVFTRLLDDRHPHIRKQAIEQLTLLKVNGAIPRLKQMVKADTDEHVRGACARALGDLQDKTSLDLLEAALEDHAVVRFQAVLALGKIGNSAAAPSLLALLKDSQPEIRYQAVRAIGQLKLEGSEEHIEPLLQDSDVMVRRGAEQTLQEFGMSPSQIRRKRFQKSFSKTLLAISPSYIFAALPGKAGSAVAVLTMMLAIGGVWLASNFGSFVSGSSSLPVLSVKKVRISATANLAVIWRKSEVWDIVDASTGELKFRIQGPSSAFEFFIDNTGGIIAVEDKKLYRLRSDDSYDPRKAMSKEMPEKPLAVCFHPKDNLCCLFMPAGSNTRLELRSSETLEVTKSYEIKARFDGQCLVSSDQKIAVSMGRTGELSIADLATGQVVKTELASLIKGGNLGFTMAVQFSEDMKHFCFCTSTDLFVLSLGKIKLEKRIHEDGGFVAVCMPKEGGIVAISPKGKIVEVSNDLSSVKEKKIESDFDLYDFDAGGRQVIVADSESLNAEVFDIQQNKVITTIVGE
ncbi:MAG: HEAT repeat domain-containing protein [Planctomycetales bacterium]|nr:HEAT repeat domain-containing protein [Planctomycetales bacterium]